MSPISRRDALRAGGLAVAGGLAGCSSRSPELAAFSLGELTLWNLHERPHTATVLLLDDDDPVYRSTIDAEAADGNQAGGSAFEGYPTEAARYELYGWHDGAANDEWARLAFDPESLSTEGEEPPCVQVIFTIEAGESGGARSSFMRSLGCDTDADAQSSR